jgi:prepilin-type N-terminal cleavage/methylation domain-containing protein
MSKPRAPWEHEGGFTLTEVMVTIIIMGIVFAIASSMWFGAIESRKVDSATNQVAADLRLVHSKATNRLADYSFVTPAATVPAGVIPLSTYDTGPTGGTLVLNRLPDRTEIAVATNIRFKADGTAEVISGPPSVSGTITITVRSAKDPANNHTIQINTATSRVKVVP